MIFRRFHNNRITKSIRGLFIIPSLHRDKLEDKSLSYIIFKGGRGGLKTTSIIDYMIEQSYEYKNCAFLCAREIARSIEDSVYSVVQDMITQAGIASDFRFTKKAIINQVTGVRFLFSGLRSTGGKTALSAINKIKGQHKLRLIFLEEGQDLSEDTLNVLLPTANRAGGTRLRDLKTGEEKVVEEIAEFEGARFFVAMNPNKELDPVVVKFRPFVEAGLGCIEHINMMDIVESDPSFRPYVQSLINQMELERDQFYFDHVWLGAPFHKFSGMPFSKHNFAKMDGKTVCYFSWLDPSFKGGDYTAIAFLGEIDGRPAIWGHAFKQAWNMSPTIDTIGQLYREYAPTKFYYEDNSLGTVPKTELGKQGIPALGSTTLTNKEDKIYKASAFTRDLLTIETSRSNPAWLQQIRDYSDEADFDDSPDSFASVVKISGILKDKVKF